jgi:hypothetical protein
MKYDIALLEQSLESKTGFDEDLMQIFEMGYSSNYVMNLGQGTWKSQT